MDTFTLHAIGEIHEKNGEMTIQVNKEYLPALQALDGFSHLQILWYFDKFDTPEARKVLETPKPYKNAPEVMGIFATRSPVRPNPIALSTVQVFHIDFKNGILSIDWIDADNSSPVLDIKPYTPSIDKVQNPQVPDWCKHWPKDRESSGEFNWEAEMNF